MDPNNLSLKDIVLIITPLLMLVVGIYNLVIGSYAMGATLFVISSVIYIYYIFHTPWVEIAKKEYENDQKIRQHRLGRVWVALKTAMGYLSFIYLALMILGVVIVVYRNITGT